MPRRFLYALGLIVAVASVAVASEKELQVTVEKNVIYGQVDGSALLADIGYPTGNERPAIIYVH